MHLIWCHNLLRATRDHTVQGGIDSRRTHFNNRNSSWVSTCELACASTQSRLHTSKMAIMQHLLQQMQPAHRPRTTTRGSPPTLDTSTSTGWLDTSTSTPSLQLAATEERQSNVNPDNTLQISTTEARPKRLQTSTEARPQTPSNFSSPLKSGKGPEGPRNSSFMVHLDPSPVWKEKQLFNTAFAIQHYKVQEASTGMHYKY